MIYKHLISQRTVNKRSWSNPRQTQIWFIFRLWVIINALLKKICLYLVSHFGIRIIAVTCPDNKSVRNQPKSCVPAMQNHTNHHDARPILFQLKSSLPVRLFLFVWRLESTNTKSLLRHLHCRGSPLFKVPMTWKIFSAYLKGLSKYRRMAFFFLNYLFSF